MTFPDSLLLDQGFAEGGRSETCCKADDAEGERDETKILRLQKAGGDDEDQTVQRRRYQGIQRRPKCAPQCSARPVFTQMLKDNLVRFGSQQSFTPYANPTRRASSQTTSH